MKSGKSLRLIIYGPTATGKTALAIKLAKIYNGELISADSRQVYCGLDIGTGKLSIEQLNDSTIKRLKGYWIVDGVKIHGFNLIQPGKQFTASDFLDFTHTTMIHIIGVKKLPIIVGGTGFYIKSLIEGLDSQSIPSNPSLRRKLEKLSREELYERLLKINNSKAKTMNESDRLNPRRLIRAIEIATYLESTSEVKSSRHPENTSEVKEGLVIGLTAPNPFLYHRADQWLQTRLDHGMIGEVESLLKRQINPQWLDRLGLEYRWLTRYLIGQIEKDQAVERLKGGIHNFIRRQKTWFKKFKNIKVYDISQPEWESRLEKQLELWYTKANDGRK